MMKKYNNLISLLILLFVIALQFSTAFSESNIKNVKEIAAKTVKLDPATETKLQIYHGGEYCKGGHRFNSSIKDLTAILSNKVVDPTNYVVKSMIELKSTRLNINKKIIPDGVVSNIYWRPGTSELIYLKQSEEGEGSDLGVCSVNYVKIKLGKITMVEAAKVINTGEHQPCTSMAWSGDGRYLAYFYTGSIRIMNFDTKKIWSTNKINLDNGKKIFLPNTPSEFSSFLWIENGKKLLFYWKADYSSEKPAGYATIDVTQFDLK